MYDINSSGLVRVLRTFALQRDAKVHFSTLKHSLAGNEI